MRIATTLVLALILSTAPARAEAPPVYLAQWSGANLFNCMDMEIAPDGTLWILDYGTRAFHYTTTGTLLGTCANSGAGLLYEPNGIAVDVMGDVYVSGETPINYRPVVKVFNSAGVFQRTIASGLVTGPGGMATDAGRDLYVADWGVHQVKKFTRLGVAITSWGGLGTAPGQFDMPSDVASDPFGNVFVVDYRNHRVQKFTGDGVFLVSFGTYGTGEGQFRYPMAASCDALGNVYVTEYAGQRIQKFDGDGNFLTQWGPSGPGYTFGLARYTTVDAVSNVYVLDVPNVLTFGPAPVPVSGTTWGRLKTLYR